MRMRMRRWRDRNGPVDARAALLQGFEDQRLPVEIDAGDGQRQCLEYPVRCEVQNLADGAHLAFGFSAATRKAARSVRSDTAGDFSE